MNHHVSHNAQHWTRRQCINIALGFCFALPLMHNSDASAASLSRSIDVAAPPSQVWSVIGPFCAIKDWHPVVGSCSLDRAHTPTRTLVTKDGKTTFVELQTARNEAQRFYSYSFKSSPFPVTHYMGTLWVVPADHGTSTVLWTGSYTPLAGKDAEAEADFAGVYESGLAALKARFAH
ncbi:MAG: SRPBCC family protein [Rhizomicrobium sp.]